MENLDIKGYLRKKTGKQDTKRLRFDAKIPCVIYGGNVKVNFYVPMAIAKDIVYTSKVYLINIEIENKKYKTILQDIQFHPVSEIVLHMDFLQILEDKPIKVQVPISIVGESPGVLKGGLLTKNLRKLTVKGLPKNIPNSIPVDISNLELGKSIKIKDISVKDYEIITSKLIPAVSVIVPRALRSKTSSEETAETENVEKK